MDISSFSNYIATKICYFFPKKKLDPSFALLQLNIAGTHRVNDKINRYIETPSCYRVSKMETVSNAAKMSPNYLNQFVPEFIVIVISEENGWTM